MRKKFISAFMLGLLAIGTTSTISSCKDYDGDISSLKDQISTLATKDELSAKITELQNSIASAKSEALAAAQDALKAAQAAQATGDAAKAAAAQNAADLAQAKADLQKAIADATTDLTAKIDANKSALDALQTLVDSKASQADLDKAVADLTKANTDVVTALNNAIAAQAIVDGNQDSEIAKALADAKANAEKIVELTTELAKKANQADLEKAIKDYEAADKALNDLIAENAKGIKANADDIKALQDALETAKAKYDKAIEDLAKADEDLDAKIDGVESAYKAADALLQQNIEKVADQATANAEKISVVAESLATLATKVGDNSAAIAENLKKIGENATQAATNKTEIAKIWAKLTGENGIEAKLSSLESQLSSVSNSEFVKNADAYKQAVEDQEDALKTLIGEVNTMITSVQLFGAIHEDCHYNDIVNEDEVWSSQSDDYNPYYQFDDLLHFNAIIEKAQKFGQGLVADADVKEFVEGRFVTTGDSVLIRVTPVDAEVKAENVTLINSQGVELNDYITVEDVHRFTGLFARGTVNTGLWVVKYNFKKDITLDEIKEFAKLAYTFSSNGYVDYKVLWAVSIKNNITGADADRRVISEFDLAFDMDENTVASPDFKVQDNCIQVLYNRFIACEQKDKDHALISTAKAEDYIWVDYKKPATSIKIGKDVKPADVNVKAKANQSGQTGNAIQDDNRWIDNVQTSLDSTETAPHILPVEINKDIVIDFNCDSQVKSHDRDGRYGNNGDIKYFFVTIDGTHALESEPSEINAWKNYKYTNVGIVGVDGKKLSNATMISGTKGAIQINSEDAIGDVIGFRVYAVNQDGTLVDPDGRSFYVRVVKDVNVLADAVTLECYSITPGQSPSMYSDLKSVEGKIPASAVKYTITPAKDQPCFAIYAGKDETHLAKLQHNSQSKENIPCTVEDFKNILCAFEPANSYVDGATYTETITFYDANNMVVGKLVVNAIKKMPAATFTAEYLAGQSKDGVSTIQVVNTRENLADNWKLGSVNSTSKFTINFRNIFVDGATYCYDVANSAYNAEKDAYSDVLYSQMDDKNNVAPLIRFDADLVDNESIHPLLIKKNLGNISLILDDPTTPDVDESYQGNFYQIDDTKTLVYACWDRGVSYKHNTAYTIKWGSNQTVGQTLESVIKLSDFTIQNVQKNLDIFGGKKLSQLVASEYLEVVDGITLSSNVAEYYSAEFVKNGDAIKIDDSGDAQIQFKVKQTMQDPFNFDGTISFKVKDCFGHETTITGNIKVQGTANKAKK